MVLTRQQRERRVLDLYNQGKNTRQIAQVGISFRDIGVIINKARQEKEEQEQQAQQLSLASRAYELFSEGENPVQVAITLNPRQPEVTEFYTEYWKLKQQYNLYQLYEELDGNIEPFLKLHRLVKAAGMNTEHVTRLLKIANNDLPSVEYRCQVKDMKILSCWLPRQ